ncbi:hypothetical protein [Paractinoplanes toevensis]|uniref:Uncharacterized protein n=1 Tax=Paractinoplanes toevensis TaxID=571911 RepID=A0A920BRD8_9ACTN|nr:hypothetical protein [Actinoplanes toevensis]GIM98249.1 hypothetical protein Ato02nite_100420 [Actinoplanes toevensis]
MLVVVGSIKGSPGVTSLALGLASRWPDTGSLLVEADSDGGDLAARFGVNPEPGLAALALAIRSSGPDTVALEGFAQRLRVDAEVVLAPPSDAAAPAVEQLAASVPMLGRAAVHRSVIVDVGRLSRRSPLAPVVQAADHVVVVATPNLADLTQVFSRLQRLRATARGHVWVWLSGAGPYDEAEVSADLSVAVLGTVGRDKVGAGMLTGRYLTAPGWWRSPMVRAAGDAAARLADIPPAVGHAEVRNLMPYVNAMGVNPR